MDIFWAEPVGLVYTLFRSNLIILSNNIIYTIL